MAEFALGLTKTVVEGTVSTVQSAIEEEGKLKDKVQHDLEFIKAEFEMMQSFLHATNKERADNEVVRTWVRLLRDLAFDVEDWVEFVVHMENKPGCWWRVLPSFLAPAQHLDLAAAEIKKLKARVEDVSQRSMRYNLIGDSISNNNPIMPAKQLMPAASPLAFHILRGVWEAAGKLYGMGDLRKLITSEGGGGGNDDLQIISVWGSTGGDLGRRSMIMDAYCHGDICQEFKSRAWVKLVHPFNCNEFLKSLLSQLCRNSHQADAAVVDFREMLNTEDNLMKTKLTKEKYLVVLEDVSNVVEWDDIKMYLPDCKNGSRIVVSTHDIGMAFMCTGKPYLVSELRRFPDGHSLCAFLRRKVRESPIDFSKLKKQIKCRGVISVWGSSGTKSIIIDDVYQGIMKKQEELYGLEFERYGWVPVPNYGFDLRLISRQLHLNLLSSGHESVDDEELEADPIQRCCEFLRENDCLVVIDGLQSTKDWDLFKANLLSKGIKGCIIVITDEENVAKHCIDSKDQENVAKHCVDCKDRAPLNIKDDLKSSTAEYLGYQRSPHEIFSTTREKALSWLKTAQIVRSHEEQDLGFFMLLRYPGVVPVWGISGVGKSYLVRTSYYHHMLRLPRLFKPTPLTIENKFTAYSWVHVPHPFNLMEFSRCLLVDFYSDDLQSMEMAAVGIMQGQDLIEECCKLLRHENYFIVIDGLQTTHDWELIKNAFFPRHVHGCVVVITNEAKVARHCQVNELRRVNVKGFQADEAYNLFMEVVWNNKELTPDEKELSKRILSKCGGLPTIISAIGKYCRPDHSKLKNISDDFMDSLETDEQGFHSLRGLFSWMKSYFDYACSDTLKPCIFYLSVFPVNQNIRRRRLLRRWIAEGYCRGKASITVEEEGGMLLSELISLSIIQVQDTPGKNLQLNGFFREYLISRPMEGNLVFALKGNCTLGSQRTGQHLTIRSSWDRDMIVFESIDFSRLRSLTVSGEWRPFFVSAKNNMKLLRVLDLENTSGVTNDDLEHITKLLHRLKFLSLRGCREVTCLPDSLGCLKQLQTLDIRHTSILTLPLAITKLEKLQYMNSGTTEPWDLTSPPEATSEDQASTPLQDEVGISTPPPRSSRVCNLVPIWLSNKFQRRTQDGSVKVPQGIGKLTVLQTLGVINLTGAGGMAISKELKKLTQLRKLGVSGINKGNYQELFSAISDHAHLVSLSVRLEKDKDGAFCNLDGISKPPRTLKKLKLYGHMRKLPTWMKQLDHLSKVDLEMTILKQKDTRFYEQLPSQFIRGHVYVKPIQNGQVDFGLPEDPPCRPFTKQFQVFKIDCTTGLLAKFGKDYITNNVQLLVVHCSSGSSFQISGLEHLLHLKEVWLKGSYSKELWHHLQQKLSEHRNKPILKPEQPCVSS